MKGYKTWLIGASLLATLTLAGCSTADNNDGASTSSTEIAQGVTPLYIAMPTVMQVEDNTVDTAKLQEKLEEVNDGKRLEGYKPVNKDERVMEVPTKPVYKDGLYNKVKPESLEKGTHFVYVGRNTCPYCTMLRVNLDPVVEQLGLTLEYVDTEDKSNESYMVENFELSSVPQLVVMHDGEAVASFPQENMYLETGVNYQSLANGLGDLTNIYLSYKHDLPLEGIQDDIDTTEDSKTEDSKTEDSKTEEGKTEEGKADTATRESGSTEKAGTLD